jgi:glycosyltransferase involved in cell wall biosynthesis
MSIKFSIITPVLNGEKFIEQAIQSIINQTYDNIEYIVVDGESSDRTLDVINKYKQKISKVIVHKDKTMYEALLRGFNNANGEYFCWINSDDYLLDERSVERAVNYIQKYKQEWFNCNIAIAKNYDKPKKYFPFLYPKWILKKGLANNCFWGFVQQENTIFSKKLYNKVNGVNPNFKMAGDYDLWKRFAQYEKLNPVNLDFACHRKSANQLTDLDNYYKEIGKNRCKFNLFYPFRIIISFVNKFFIPKIK